MLYLLTLSQIARVVYIRNAILVILYFSMVFGSLLFDIFVNDLFVAGDVSKAFDRF